MNYQKKYIFVGLSLVLLLVASQLIIHYFLFQKKEDATLLNTAGRQRMLSQRIHLFLIKDFYSLGTESDSILASLIDEWKSSHLDMLEGDKKLGLSPIKDPILKDLFEENLEIIKEIEQIIGSSQVLDSSDLKVLGEKFEDFLSRMESIVDQIESKANNKLLNLVFIQTVLALLIFAIVLLEFRMIILPIFKNLQQNEDMLLEKNQELTVSKNKLKAILDSTFDINLLISPDYKILNFNKVANDIAVNYFKKPYVEGDDIRDYYLKEDIEILEQYMPKVLQGEEFFLEIEREIQGQKVWFELTKKPVYDDNGQILGASTNLKDISIKKEKERLLNESTQKLRDSDNKLRAVYESSNHGYVLLSPDYTILSANNTAKKDALAIFGKAMEENMSMLDFTIPESREVFLKDSKLAFEGEYVRREIRVAGSWFQFNYFPVYSKEEGLIGVSMNVINIEDRMLIEEYNTALINSIPDQFFVIDSSGFIVDNKLETGSDKDPELNKRLDQVFPDPIAMDIMYAVTSSLAEQKVNEVSFDCTENGEHRFYQAKISPVSANKVIVLLRDVTNLVRQQEEIHKRDQILRGITWQQSHVVRKPIANILGICELFKRQISKGEEVELQFIQYVNECALELDQIVREIVEKSSVIKNQET